MFYKQSFLFSFFDGGLGDFSDNSDGDGLFHVSDGESSEGGILLERFNTHGFGGFHDGEARVSGFDGFGVGFEFFGSSSINFFG
jgi:hypothetical protein